MKNHIKKISTINKVNESILEGFFNKSNQKKQGDLDGQGNIVTTDFYEVKPDKSVIFSNGSKAKSIFPSYPSLQEYLINKKQHQWILQDDVNFDVRIFSIDDKKLSLFKGVWSGGVFSGNDMGDIIFNKGFFNGNIFKNGKWNVSPFNFVKGKWVGENILGLSNIDNLNQKKFNFNILSILPGRKMIINTQSGDVYEIHVLKRLDDVNSSFEYKVKFPNSDNLLNISIPWNYIRGNSESEFFNRVKFSNSHIPTLFLEKFSIDINSPVINIQILESSEKNQKIESPQKEKTPEELSKEQYYYDLSKINFLGIKKLNGKKNGMYYNEKNLLVPNNIARVYFNAPNDEYYKEFNNVVKNLDNKILNSDISTLKMWLDNNIIDGAPTNYQWLANVIGKDTIGNKIEDKNFINSLNRIEAFLKYFVSLIVPYAGAQRRSKGLAGEKDEESKQVQELIKTNLRKILGKEAATTNNQQTSKTKTKASAFKENFEIPKLIRNILFENLKHF